LSSFAPSKRLGQHFLFDRTILRRIVLALDPAPGDVVLEVGAGGGTLTRELLARGLRVIAIEKDRRLAEALRDRVSGVGCQVVMGDALRLDWHDVCSRHLTPDTRHRLKVIGNIPYAITTPLIEKALTPPLPARIVFLVQAEVAARLAARPGTRAYGALSVGVQAVCTVERLFTVKAGAFRPTPKVESAAVRLIPRPEPLIPILQAAELRAFATACFGARRKQLRNAVARATGLARGIVEAGLRTLGLDPSTRPEQLPPAEFVRLLLWSREL
jgi:16S rRNA (adenine1518-N6/adenine1519-N6)-dimethyltransferase